MFRDAKINKSGSVFFLLLVPDKTNQPNKKIMKGTLQKAWIAAVFVLLTGGPLAAQFKISAEFRPRGEYRDGYSKLLAGNQEPVFDILGRNRLIFDYKYEQFTAKFSFQHAYVYGENTLGSDTITRNTLNIYEAWFQYNFIRNIGIKLGRMELIYDDQRLLGNGNWSPRAVTHDAGQVKWDYADRSYRGDLGFAINNTAPMQTYLSPYPLKNYKYLAYLYEQKKLFKDQLVLALLGITDIFQKPAVTTKTTTYDSIPVFDNTGSVIGYTQIPVVTTTTKANPEMLYARFTVGGNVGFSWKNLKVFGAAYYQGGHYNDGHKISAGFYGGYVSYKVLKPLTLLVGYERLTGNDFSDTTGMKTRLTSFSTLYGTSHSKYGYMDMFSSHVTSGNSAGLRDFYAQATVRFTEKASLEATWRWFGLAQGYLNKKDGNLPYTKVDKNLGHEIDLMVIYTPVKNLEMNAAYCFFLPTDAMNQLNGLKAGTSDFAQYAYIQLTYRPTFFNTEK